MSCTLKINVLHPYDKCPTSLRQWPGVKL
jgi:hypothetical protein